MVNVRLLMPVLALLFSVAVASAQPVESATTPVEASSGKASALDTSRFQTSPYPLQAQVFRQEFNHAELNVNPVTGKSLVVGGNVQNEYCADRSIRKAMLYARLKMGPTDYEFGYTDFTVQAIVQLTARKANNTIIGPSPYLCTLKVEGTNLDVKPEQLFRTEFTAIYDQVDHIDVNVLGYTFNSTAAAGVVTALQNNVRLEAYFTEEFALPAVHQSQPAAASPVLEILPLTTGTDGKVGANPVTFQWKIIDDCGNDRFPNYQLQILRLYNRDAAKPKDDETQIRETVDWNRALTVETGNDKTELTLTLAEGNGYYTWRVRPIGDQFPGGIANDRNWGVWTVAPGSSPGNANLNISGVTDPSITSYNGAVFFYKQFNREKNWAYTRAFSEGDDATRIGEGISYVTSLLQERQTQHHLQSEGRFMMSQAVQDYSGRTSLGTLPAPVQTTGFAYQNTLMPATGGGVYGPAQFDDGSSAGGSWHNPQQIAGSGPLYDYYSDQNADLQVPNADRYPFGRTLFYPDATGRAREIGGAGSVHRIGGGAESLDRTTKFYYGRATDAELVRLFGDEAPASNTVQRVTTVDANKVVSISYVTHEGRTIATCLARTTIPDGAHLLDLTEPQVQDAIAEEVRKNVRSAENEIISSTTITLVAPTTVSVDYEIWPKEIANLCTSTCKVCEYKVEFIAIPMDDPDNAIHTEPVVVPPGVCDPNTPATHHWTTTAQFSNLPAGSYTIVKRLYVDPEDGNGEHASLVYARQVEQSAIDAANASPIVTQARTYLGNADLEGLYGYLDTKIGSGVSKSDGVYTIDAGCCQVTIEEKKCDPTSPCDTSKPDFEKLLFDTYGSTFGTNLDKYFFNSLGQPLYPELNSQRKGQFNLMIEHMIADPVHSYDCGELWAIWVPLVRDFSRAATTDGDGDPNHLKPDYNLLEEFLTRAGKQYQEVSGEPYGTWTDTYSNHASITRHGFLEYAYRCFYHAEDNPSNDQCRAQYLGTGGRILLDTRGVSPQDEYKADPVMWDGLGADDRTGAATNKKWERIYECLQNRGADPDIDLPPGCDPPGSQECAIAMRDKVEAECRSQCEQHRDGFRRSIVEAYHAMNLTVAGDAYRPDNGNPIPPGGPFDISASQVDCLASLLVQNCADSCHLSLVYDQNNPTLVTRFGTEEEERKLNRIVRYTWEVSLPQNGVCPQGDEWLHITDAHADRAFAEMVASKLNDGLKEYRAAGGDANTPAVTAQTLWELYANITGDNSLACQWYTQTITRGTEEEGCCPPQGLPKIFTLGSNIDAHFEIEAPCKLVYVRSCRQGEYVVTNREILCTDICTAHQCQGLSVCFRWKLPVSPDVNFTDDISDCSERVARELTSELDNQIATCAALERATVEKAYASSCTMPEGVNDLMKVNFSLTRYHFTLYYYDRVGRLVRTVPPAGVNPLGVGATRANHPNHSLVTFYDYNSLGQLLRKRTPDGNVDRIWYDSRSRGRFTQKFEQLGRNAFSYVKYDALGRVVERGESILTNEAELTANADDNTWPSANLADVFTTTYDTPSLRSYEPGTPRARTQQHLRNRVSSVSSGDGSTETVYGYDAHGNIEWVTQYLRGLGENYMRYEYDLISGNMRGLYYNEGLGDQLAQRYFFDADNRALRVESSRDGVIWDRDATYSYFLHGPLKRASYGEDSLQGVDYTYTIQGWLKGMNHPSLVGSVDPGRDADQGTTLHARYGADAFGMTLHYYEGDYLRKKQGVGNSPFNSQAVAGQYTRRGDDLRLVDLPGNPLAKPINLYNGNIAGWSNQVMPAPAGAGPAHAYEQLTGETYRYDLLNRILSSSFNTFTPTPPNGATTGAGTWAAPGDYDTWYQYDPNGNILQLGRHGWTAGGYLNMDNLAYGYAAGKNRLLQVQDAVGNTAPATDYQNQPAMPGLPPGPNFGYDGSGRLIMDKNERITNTIWKSYDKVEEVQKMFGATRLRFVYDAQGNRVKKEVAGALSGTTTYYVREAGGKVIAIYTKQCLDGNDFAGGQGDGGCVDPLGPPDTDHDGIPDYSDNADSTFNPDQRDTDGDGIADVNEYDRDNDGKNDFPPPSFDDPCPFDAQNLCDAGDKDGDGVPDVDDPCPETPGTGGPDRDADGIPDACDQDIDGDGVPNNEDNCPWTPNPDQADLNNNNIGDVCECSGVFTGNGGCPKELGEQFVYGSGFDGRVATIRPDHVRDMQDYSANTIFTRDLADKEYELNDHLGNVRARFSDVKLSQNTAGTAPFKVDLLGYVNYYPFGMAQPDREFNMSGGRYGYNGKEMDNEWNNGQAVAGGTGNSYDFSARIYDPRLARWSSRDRADGMYPGLSPYSSVANSPQLLVDHDGNNIYFWDKNDQLVGVIITDARDVSYRLNVATSQGVWAVIDPRNGWGAFGHNGTGIKVALVSGPLKWIYGKIYDRTDFVGFTIGGGFVIGGIGTDQSVSLGMMLHGPDAFKAVAYHNSAGYNEVLGLGRGGYITATLATKTEERGVPDDQNVTIDGYTGPFNSFGLSAGPVSASIFWNNDDKTLPSQDDPPIPWNGFDWLGINVGYGIGPPGVMRSIPFTSTISQADFPGKQTTQEEHLKLKARLPSDLFNEPSFFWPFESVNIPYPMPRIDTTKPKKMIGPPTKEQMNNKASSQK